MTDQPTEPTQPADQDDDQDQPQDQPQADQQDDLADQSVDVDKERDDTTNVVLGDVNVTGQDNRDDDTD